MPDWSALRRRAYAHHLRLRAAFPDETLLPAETLLAAAEKETGIRRRPLPPDDPLLAGANALLDRDANRIWYASGGQLTKPRRWLVQAHEFGHYWLHPDLESDSVLGEDEPSTFLPPTAGYQLEEGYGPAERREKEADLFAAEFLLPLPLVRRAFVAEGWSASRIAAHVGLTESCVLAQLTEAVLRPATAASPPSTEPTLQQADNAVTPQNIPVAEQRAPSAPQEEPRTSLPLPLGALLDPSQRAAAEIERGPVLVDAGPGTGKTRTLVARILHLLQARQVIPENILALTFSNKAAEEMRTRLRDQVGDDAERVWIGTFHAFGLEILRKDGTRLGLPHRPRLIETVDAVLLLERYLDRLNLREFEYLHQPSLPFPDILRCISRAKDERKTPADYKAAAMRQYAAATSDQERQAAEKSLEIAHVYAVYQELLQAFGLLDFGDLLMRPVELLDTCPDVRARWQAQYPQILADEYQDINRASAELLQRLAGDGWGFWAVGDLRQAIYRFRGASPANVEEFEHDFPGGRRLRLEVNYRSRPHLVSLFSATAVNMAAGPAKVPAEGARRPAKSKTSGGRAAEATNGVDPRLENSYPDKPEWQAHRRADGQPALTLAQADNEEAQAEGLANLIRDWEAAGVERREQAILCSTNAQAADLAARLEQRGIPTQHLGGLFERAEVKDLLALVALACEPEGSALARVARFPEYAIPDEDVTHLLQAAREQNRAFPAALELASDLPDLSEAGRTGFQKLWSHLKPIVYRGDAWLLVTRYLFDRSDYLRPLLAREGVAEQQNRLAIYQLLQFMQGLTWRMPPEEGQSQHTAFLVHLRRLMLVGEAKSVRSAGLEELDGVRLMTVHQSKGLEFPVVYLPNLIQGQFPFRRMGSMAAPPPGLIDVPGAEAEADAASEECLFFVALSRARDHLVLSRPATWRSKAAQPSRLLKSIEAFLDACGARRVTWQAPGSPGPAPADAEPDESILPLETPAELVSAPLPTVSLSALDQYRECPRRYFYQRVARLPEREGESPYLAFHLCLQQTLRWLHDERAAGRKPLLSEAQAQLETLWVEKGPNMELGLARLLRQHADLLLANAHQDSAAPVRTVSDIELVAELPNGRIQVPCEHAEHLPDGTLRVERHVRRRAKKDDHTDERLALMRVAAKQQAPDQPVQVTLNYLQDGAKREVPESPRYEPARVEKYNIALQGIREERFPAAPDERRCAQCPFLFICPS